MQNVSIKSLVPGKLAGTTFPASATLGAGKSLLCSVHVTRLPSDQPHWVVMARWRANDGAQQAQLRCDMVESEDQDEKVIRLFVFEISSPVAGPARLDLLDELLTELMPVVLQMATDIGAEGVQVVLEDTMYASKEHRHADVPDSDPARATFIEAIRPWACEEAIDPRRHAGQPRRFFAPASMVGKWMLGPEASPTGATKH